MAPASKGSIIIIIIIICSTITVDKWVNYSGMNKIWNGETMF